jgi:hypothetical protein
MADLNDQQRQTAAAEKYLLGILDKICLNVDLRKDDWELNKDLLIAISKSYKSKKKKDTALFYSYDQCFNMLKKLNIKISAKFKWFTNLEEHVK